MPIYTLIFQKGQVLTGKIRISNPLNDYTTPLNITQLKPNVKHHVLIKVGKVLTMEKQKTYRNLKQ